MSPSPLLPALALLLASCLATAAGDTDAGSAANSDGGVLADAKPRTDSMPSQASLESLLTDLRNNRDLALLTQSRAQGWPAPVEGGHLFVSAGPENLLAGDHNNWVGAPMMAEDDFYWKVVNAPPGTRYKFTDGAESWAPDPWSRSYEYDSEGEMSMLADTASHIERHFQVSDAQMPARRVRIWVPPAATHVLYAHDGQNLFDPAAFGGGWKLTNSAPPGMMIVGIDNTSGRMDEYTHTTDNLGGTVGGQGDAYAAFVQVTVRALVSEHYGEAPKVGTMGSSLGGLISLHIADRYPGEYDFAASLSGTVGWGSIGNTGTDTIIARYAAAGHRGTAIYIDSGGNGDTCVDSDGDGTNDDDGTASDNYCENRQLEATLAGQGYVYNTDLWHWWEPNALHNEQAWAARVFRPLANFMTL